MWMVPLVGSSRPINSRNSVVFPQPDGPSRQRLSLNETENDKSEKIAAV